MSALVLHQRLFIILFLHKKICFSDVFSRFLRRRSTWPCSPPADPLTRSWGHLSRSGQEMIRSWRPSWPPPCLPWRTSSGSSRGSGSTRALRRRSYWLRKIWPQGIDNHYGGQEGQSKTFWQSPFNKDLELVSCPKNRPLDITPTIVMCALRDALKKMRL